MRPTGRRRTPRLVSSSAWHWPGPRSSAPSCCWPTSRRAIRTPATSPPFSNCSARWSPLGRASWSPATIRRSPTLPIVCSTSTDRVVSPQAHTSQLDLGSGQLVVEPRSHPQPLPSRPAAHRRQAIRSTIRSSWPPTSVTVAHTPARKAPTRGQPWKRPSERWRADERSLTRAVWPLQSSIVYSLTPKLVVIPTFSYLGVRSLLTEYQLQGHVELAARRHHRHCRRWLPPRWAPTSCGWRRRRTRRSMSPISRRLRRRRATRVHTWSSTPRSPRRCCNGRTIMVRPSCFTAAPRSSAATGSC